MSKTKHCFKCMTKLIGHIDNDPNGEENPDCARCRAEEDHDFDAEPNVTFERDGSRTNDRKQSIFDLFTSIPYCTDDLSKIIYPNFKVRLAVIYRRPPRHPYFEPYLDIGRNLYDPILNHTKLPRTASAMFMVFPERWLGVTELVDLMQKLHTHPQAVAGEVRTVEIVTSSAQLITNFTQHHFRVVKFSDDKE